MATVSPPHTWSYALHLPHDPRAPRIARMTPRAVLPACGLAELADLAELLTSELVTNAYRHSEGPAALRLRGTDDPCGLRVSVWDTNPHIPSPFDKPPGRRGPLRPVPHESDSGRGLGLVAQWARAWGGHPLGDDLFGRGGKLLWFELGA
ncbi:ATP-binding protein [Streptomyces formicae]|uniref:Serine phosphatase RsbU, regulator of sigma subunit n=1 Tax=Streptomyces formicae TaxID=1616117 RepID=A0A291QEN9_9ACTN|nr:ATP-binding protein [Streptomyces formicae]ATL30028.1 Serine phosphatase RsbU, regulator of sigma subunit [Streptomyces formicae]